MKLNHWELVFSPERFDRETVAYDRACPREVLEFIVFNPHKGEEHRKVLSAVAQNFNCSPKILRHLALHHYDTIRRNVADNPFCPVAILKQLEHDPVEEVRNKAKEELNNKKKFLEAMNKLKDFTYKFDDFYIAEKNRMEIDLDTLNSFYSSEKAVLDEKQKILKEKLQ